MRSINEATVSGTGGRLTRLGYVHFFATKRTMPAQDRARCDHAMSAQHLRQPPDQRGEDRSIRPVQARYRGGSAQHGDFVAQHQEFDVLRRRRAAEQQREVQQLQEDQIQQT